MFYDVTNGVGNRLSHVVLNSLERVGMANPYSTNIGP